jgi:hypothetical protein
VCLLWVPGSDPACSRPYDPDPARVLCVLIAAFSVGLGTCRDSEDHHFESKADAGASKTYPQQAGTIRKNGHVVIKQRPCKVRTPAPIPFSR